MNYRLSEFRAAASAQIAASLAGCRNPHAAGPLYTPEQVVSTSIAIASLLATELAKLEEQEHPERKIDLYEPRVESPSKWEGRDGTIADAVKLATETKQDAPAGSPPSLETTAGGDASQGKGDASKDKDKDETTTSPQSPHGKAKHAHPTK